MSAAEYKMKGDVKGEVGSWKLKEQRAKSKKGRCEGGARIDLRPHIFIICYCYYS